jgi:toxin ParE1/3/4
MKVVYTQDALRDIDEILKFIKAQYPGVLSAFERRLRVSTRRIETWPESAPPVSERPNSRVLTLQPYPYRLFYRVTADAVEILHVHHAARQEPWQSED